MSNAEPASEARTKIAADSAANAVYEALLVALAELGPYEIEAKKTSIHITHGRAFLGVHPRKGALLLNIVTQTPIESARIKKTDRVSANRYHNELVVAGTEELDAELLSWIRGAYTLTS